MIGKVKSKRGVTLAESLIVIGIIAVLLAVGIISVVNHRRSLTQFEYDGIAKEIFIAAQNHLTAADEQGYLGRTKAGTAEEPPVDSSEGAYYFIVGGPATDSSYTSPDDGETVLNLMLPFGAVDETVRVGGSYIVRYHPESAQVLDVFYTPVTGRYKHTYTTSEYSKLMTEYRDGCETPGDARTPREKRRDYGGAVLGYYGGVEPGSLVTCEVKTPTFEIHNEEKLYVTVNNPNPVKSSEAIELQLIVTGKTSHSQKVIPLFRSSGDPQYSDDNGVTFNVVFDDITTEQSNFNYLFCSDVTGYTGGAFYPGEDIEVRVVAFATNAFSNIAETPVKTANSLFSNDTDAEGGTADIRNIRHLENLSPDISGIPNSPISIAPIKFSAAVQSKDLSWREFRSKTQGDSTVIYLDGKGDHTEAGCYMPVDPPGSLKYDGNSHRISDVRVLTPDNAGLFGTIVNGYVRNVELVDFDIESTGRAAGGLAGVSDHLSEISGVLVRNTSTKDDSHLGITGVTYTGGLIGKKDGGVINCCAASVYVDGGSGVAGGLAGGLDKVTVTECYSGGHTSEGKYLTTESGDARVNVTGATAGGLIGSAVDGSVSYTYSTCSAKGETAGGLIGSASALSVSGSYSTGLVLGTGDSAVTGAFVGTASGIPADPASDGNRYFGIINPGTPAIGNGDETIAAHAFDATVDGYNGFVGDYYSEDGVAFAYDEWLVYAYGGKACMPTLEKNHKDGSGTIPPGSDSWPSYMKNRHYGDWPSPETNVINEHK